MIELLDKKHNGKDFDCGKQLLNNYLKNQARQDMKRKLSACFVLVENDSDCIQGYYTLSNNSIPHNCFSEQIKKKLGACSSSCYSVTHSDDLGGCYTRLIRQADSVT